MLPRYKHIKITSARVWGSQNTCRPETPTVITPYWEGLEICFAPVWLEQALTYTMTIFNSANDL